MTRCETCNIAFSGKLLKRHLEGDHTLHRCRACRSVVQRYRETPAGWSVAFCSYACQNVFEKRRVCLSCFVMPFRGPWRTCASCQLAFSHAGREAWKAGEELRAIGRAHRLPKIYRRDSLTSRERTALVEWEQRSA